MGSDFVFYNQTRNESFSQEDGQDGILTRNIDRGTINHFVQVILRVIRLKKWSIEDVIREFR